MRLFFLLFSLLYNQVIAVDTENPKKLSIHAIVQPVVDFRIPGSAVTSPLKIKEGDVTYINESAIQAIRNHPEVKLFPGGTLSNTCSYLARTFNVSLIGAIGDDDAGKFLKERLTQDGVIDSLTVLKGQKTSQCWIVAYNAEPNFNFVSGASQLLSTGYLPSFKADYLMLEVGILSTVTGYDTWEKATASYFPNQIIIALTKKFLVEQHKQFLKEYLSITPVHAVFGNQEEYNSLLECNSIEIINKLKHSFCSSTESVVTEGSKGIRVVHNKEVYHEFPRMTIPNIVDLTGAGDFAMAGYLEQRLQGAKYKECLKKANKLAGQIIQVEGSRLSN